MAIKSWRLHQSGVVLPAQFTDLVSCPACGIVQGVVGTNNKLCAACKTVFRFDATAGQHDAVLTDGED